MRDAERIDEDECMAIWCAGQEWCAVTGTMKFDDLEEKELIDRTGLEENRWLLGIRLPNRADL